MVNDAKAMDQVRDLVVARFTSELTTDQVVARLVDLVESTGRELIGEVHAESGGLAPANDASPTLRRG